MRSALLAQFIENMNTVAFIKDLAGHYLLVNREFERVTGLSRETLAGKTDHDLWPEPWGSQFEHNDRMVIETGDTTTMEEVLPGNRARLFLARKFPLRDENGQIYAVGGVATDISDRMEATRAIALSEERFRNLIDHSPEAFVVLDVEKGHFVDGNENAARMFRMPLGELLRKHPAEVSPPEQPDGASSEERARQKIQAAIDGERPIFEWTHRTSDGEDIPCLIWLARLPATNAILIRASILDLRERVRAETTLRRESRLLTQVQAIASVGGWELDVRRGSLYWTTETYCLHELEADGYEPTVEKMATFFPGEGEQQVRAAMDELVTSGQAFDLELPFVTARGQPRWVRLIGTAVLAGAGQRPITAYGTLQDVTQRRREAEVLKESEERLRLALEAGRMGTWSLDAATERVEWSLETGLIFNAGVEGPLATLSDFMGVVHPEDRERLATTLRETIDGVRDSYTIEVRCLWADGSIRWMEGRGRADRPAPGRRARRLVGIAVDITERKQAEAERERLIADLAEKNQHLEQFTHTVSHDLKTPLVTIKLGLALLGRWMTTGTLDRAKSDLARVGRAADRMESLLSELLDLARIGRTAKPRERICLGDSVRRAIDLLEPRLVERRITIDVATDLPCVVGDPGRLEEMFVNLLDNAIKFMGEQPQPRIEIGAGTSRGCRAVFVRDNGIGIAPQYQEKVFGLFERIESETEGTGVGLAIVRRILESHGGSVWVESSGPSEQAAGATFWLALPFID